MASLNLKPPSPPGRPAAADGLKGGRPATSDGWPPRIRGRQPVRYPRWVHLVCAAVVAAHIAKLPALTAFAVDRSRDEPAVSDDISDELLASAVRTGVGVVVLFGAIVACVVLATVTWRIGGRRAVVPGLALTMGGVLL